MELGGTSFVGVDLVDGFTVDGRWLMFARPKRRRPRHAEESRHVLKSKPQPWKEMYFFEAPALPSD